jgi:hypothetical protein
MSLDIYRELLHLLEIYSRYIQEKWNFDGCVIVFLIDGTDRR